jgi:hypothetical protein
MLYPCQISAKTTENVTIDLKNMLITLVSASYLVRKPLGTRKPR